MRLSSLQLSCGSAVTSICDQMRLDRSCSLIDVNTERTAVDLSKSEKKALEVSVTGWKNQTEDQPKLLHTSNFAFGMKFNSDY
eukprot:1659141-Amphidinium_carterae.1